MEVLIFTFIIMALALITLGVFGKEFTNSRLSLPGSEERKTKNNIQLHTFLEKIFPFSAKILEKAKLYEKIKQKVDAAHTKLSVRAFFNLKILIIIGLIVFAFVVFKKMEPLMLIVCLGLGYLIPDIFLNRMIAKRKNAIAKILPETVDLLGLCVEAGLDFATSCRWIIEKTPMNPMLEELSFVLEEIKWGKSRTQALKDMSKRLNISEISSFVQTLVLAERMGTPVAESFMMLSEDARMQRFHRGERIALKAPLKILIPLIFCILPVIGIVIGAPILLDFLGNKIF